MTGTLRVLGWLIFILGIIAVIVGGIFVWQGFAKQKLILDRMEIEKVTLAIDPNNPDATTTVSNADEAQKAADLIASHRRSIAPTYQDLLGDGRFDPTNPTHVTYIQALNLENYLYTAVMAFGMVQIALGAGAFMIVTGAALIMTGIVFKKIKA